MSELRARENVDAPLLGFLARTLGVTDIAYVEAPEPLAGGFYSDIYAFRLSAGPWTQPLVLRVHPSIMRPRTARLEEIVQNTVADGGVPAPRVLVACEDASVLGRPFSVMERLPGVPMMGSTAPHRLVLDGPRILARVPRTLAALQLRLHAVDAAPVARALEAEGIPPGIEGWFSEAESKLAGWDEHGLDGGLDWLREHAPVPRTLAVCHGDLWPGNVLVDGARVTGLIDWNVAAVADPALDVGFTRMAMGLAAIAVPYVVQQALAVPGRWMARRFVDLYRANSDVDERSVRYYEAMRCLLELVDVVRYRRGEPGPVSNWDRGAERVVRHFRTITGVTLELPARAVG